MKEEALLITFSKKEAPSSPTSVVFWPASILTPGEPLFQPATLIQNMMMMIRRRMKNMMTNDRPGWRWLGWWCWWWCLIWYWSGLVLWCQCYKWWWWWWRRCCWWWWWMILMMVVDDNHGDRVAKTCWLCRPDGANFFWHVLISGQSM